jgi:hypothetical protein
VPRIALQFVGEAVLVDEAVGEPAGHLERFLPGEDGRTRVPLLLRRVPILLVAGKVYLGLPFLGLGFLQAEDVRLMLGHELLERALPHHGADAVDVPRIEFHRLFATLKPR